MEAHKKSALWHAVLRSEWESVCEGVSAVGSEKCTQAEVKKKLSEIKVDVKWKMAAHHVTKTGGGTGEEGPPLFEQRVGDIVGDIALLRVVGVNVGDSDYPLCVTHNRCVHTVACSQPYKIGSCINALFMVLFGLKSFEYKFKHASISKRISKTLTHVLVFNLLF